jgi:uncharacterized membrane protein YeaQ/YmgE (transglycosylase-associated protein family)
MVLNPGGIIAWILIGLIAGWLAGIIVAGGGLGIIGDIVVGIIGALIGGWLLTAFGLGGAQGFWGSLVVALIGAVVLLAIVRLIVPGRGRV